MSRDELARYIEHVKRQALAAQDERTRFIRLLVLALAEATATNERIERPVPAEA